MRQKGGSVASDSVTGLVNSETYVGLNKSFTNRASCGGSAKKLKGGQGCKLCNGGCASCKVGGNVFKSTPALAGQNSPPRGGNMRTMSELMSQNSGHMYSLRNQSGGNSAKDIGLNYNKSIMNASIPVGKSSQTLGNSSLVNQMLATESVGAMPALNKVVSYGAVANNSSFNYSGSVLGGGSLKTLATDAKEMAKKAIEKAKNVLSSKNNHSHEDSKKMAKDATAMAKTATKMAKHSAQMAKKNKTGVSDGLKKLTEKTSELAKKATDMAKLATEKVKNTVTSKK